MLPYLMQNPYIWYTILVPKPPAASKAPLKSAG